MAITYATAGTFTAERRFQVHDEEFEKFDTFPLIVVESGSEDSEPHANRVSESIFHPAVHFFIEDAAADTIEGWRDSIRNAIYNSTSLRGHATSVIVSGIEVSESEIRKLAHLKFNLDITFDITHT